VRSVQALHEGKYHNNRSLERKYHNNRSLPAADTRGPYRSGRHAVKRVLDALARQSWFRARERHLAPRRCQLVANRIGPDRSLSVPTGPNRSEQFGG